MNIIVIMSCLSLLVTRRVVTSLTMSSSMLSVIVMVETLVASSFLFPAADSLTAVLAFIHNLNTCLEGYLTYWLVIKLFWLVEFNIKLVWMVVVGNVIGLEEEEENVPELITSCGYQVQSL